MIQGDIQDSDGMTGPLEAIHEITIVRAQCVEPNFRHTQSGLPGNRKGIAFNDFANGRHGGLFPTAMTGQSSRNRLSNGNLAIFRVVEIRHHDHAGRDVTWFVR